MGKHESEPVWLLSETQYGHNVTDSGGGYLRRGVTPHKYMLNTCNFQS